MKCLESMIYNASSKHPPIEVEDEPLGKQGELFGGNSILLPHPSLTEFEQRFSALRHTQMWLSDSGKTAFYRVDLYQRKLSWQLFFLHLLIFVRAHTNMRRVTISMAFLIQNQLSGQVDLFYPSTNSSIINYPSHLYINQRDIYGSLKRIQTLIQKAQSYEFMNRMMQEYADNSKSSIAYPYYCLYTAMLI